MMPLLNLLATLALIGLVVYWSLGIKRRLRQLKVQEAALPAHVWNTALLARELPPGVLPPTPGGWAASADLLVELMRVIRDRQPLLAVELGSGLSTLIIAQELKRLGRGRLVSIEHDPAHAARTRASLEQAGLSAQVDLRIAPLEREGAGWYTTAALEDLDAIDLLLVDGPPANRNPDARAAALPFFWPRLASFGLMIFDDASRPAEDRMATQWAQANAAQAKLIRLPLEKGCILVEKTAGQ